MNKGGIHVVEVYKHVPKELAQDIVHCGLKLSRVFDSLKMKKSPKALI
jgi:hypothetical protein